MDTITATATVTAWDEHPAPTGEAPTPRVASASVRYDYEGAVTGSSECTYALYYAPDGTAPFVGVELVTAHFGEGHGTVALRHVGSYGTDGVRAELGVVPGSGTGVLEGVSGEGTFVSRAGEHGGRVELRLSTRP